MGPTTRRRALPSTCYLIPIVVYAALLLLLETLLPTERFRFGLLLTDATALAVGVVSVLLWWRYRPVGRWPAIVVVFLATWILLWAWAFGLSWSRGEDIRFSGLLVPLTAILLWSRRLSRDDAVSSASMFAYTLAGLSLGYLLLQMIGVLPGTYMPSTPDYAAWKVGALAFEAKHYWLPLAWLPGVEWRWAGPFVHPNFAGPVGAFLFVYGLTLRGYRRVIVTGVGTMVLLLAGVRSAQLAAGIGALVLVGYWVSEGSGARRRARGWLLAGLAVVVGATAVAMIAMNPTLTGRTTIWPTYVRIWLDAPVTGVGEAELVRRTETGLLPGWARTGHNVTLDTLARLGTPAGLMVVVLLVASLVIVVRAGRAGRTGAALLAIVLVGAMTLPLVDWRYLGVNAVVLVLAVLVSVSPPREDAADAGATAVIMDG